MRLTGVSAVITGGASGLGAATTRRLAAAGVRCVVADLDEAGGTAVAGDCQAAQFVRCDVTDPASLGEAVEVAGQLGTFRVVVSCAGIAPAPQRLVSRRGQPMDRALWQRALDVHLTGTFNTILAAGSAMARSEAADGETRGVLVTTSSAARVGMEGAGPYSAAKAGIAALTATAAHDLAPLGIRCVSIAPGTFDTPMLQRVNEVSTSLQGDINDFPKRAGHPDEFAALVEHICVNDYLNGVCLPLDGGLRSF